MLRKLFLLTTLIAFAGFSQAQTVEELKASKAEKQAQIAALQGEVGAIDAQIAALPGWETGAFGTIGLNFSEFRNWLGREKANTSASNIGITFNAFAKYDEPKMFWNNALSLALGWVKFDDKDDDDPTEDFENSADAFNLSSLFGYKLTDKLAISALGEYRSTFANNFGNPGFLDLGVGITWLPIAGATVVIHPLNYNFVFSDDGLDYTSSLGAKIVGEYGRKLPMGIGWNTKLSAFLSYEDTSNLSNWTWVNSLSFLAFKVVGVGFEFGLRGNRQESLNYKRFTGPEAQLDPSVTFDTLADQDNPLQTYWVLGLTYGF